MDINKQVEQLEKLVKEQSKQIESMKKAMSVLQNRLIVVTKKAERTYHTGQKNTNNINSINHILQRKG